MQISLKDLLGVVAFCAGLAWCASVFGFASSQLWVTIGVSIALMALFVWLARSKRPLLPLAVTVPAMVIPFSFTYDILPYPLLVSGILLTIATVVLSYRPRSSVRLLTAIAMVCTLTSLIMGVLPRLADVRELMAMRQRYPVISLAGRLQYEQNHQLSAQTQTLLLSETTARELGDFESKWQLNEYDLLFRQVHSDRYQQFIRAEGFGVRRMPYVRATTLADRPPLQNLLFDDIALPTRISHGWHDTQIFLGFAHPNGIEWIYKVSRNDFLDAAYYGAIIDGNDSWFETTAPMQKQPAINVAGFVEHGMHFPPRAALTDPEAWTIDRLELVSLLKFDGPRVYMLDHLPRMDQLAANDAPTRELDEFEAEALPQLATEKDVVVKQQGDNYRMLGSLRAAKQCLSCHGVQRGELLGAFSYAIRHHSASDRE